MYDLIGVGFGPSDISLAVVLDELYPKAKSLFLEREHSSAWIPQMMLDDTDIQHSPFNDLVTLRNPRSYYTDMDILKKINKYFYVCRIRNDTPRLSIFNNCEIYNVTESDHGLTIHSKSNLNSDKQENNFDIKILATGFKNLGSGDKEELYPPILEGVKRFYTDGKNPCQIEERYKLKPIKENKKLSIYLRGLCENSHGMGDAGSFSLISIRSAAIASEVMSLDD